MAKRIIWNSSSTLQIAKTTSILTEEIGFIDPAVTHVLPEFLKTENLVDQAASGASTKIISRF